MEAMTARAFLAYQIRQAGREDIIKILRGYEKSALPEGRYLVGFEICRYLTKIGKKSRLNAVKIENPTEQEISIVDELYRQYENAQLNPGRQFEEQHGEVVVRKRVEEIHAWEDWICEELGRIAKTGEEPPGRYGND